MPTLRDLLSDSRVHVVDGAMRTMLYGRGVFLNVCYDELNLRQPELVRDIHREYLRAGAEVLETNTFGANPLKLASHGLADETERINSAAAGLAREAAGARAAVAGAIGPLGVRIEPFGELSVDDARHLYLRQVRGLLAGGGDGFVLETFSDVNELGAAPGAARERGAVPGIAQMTVGTDGKTHYGTDPEVCGPTLQALGADVVGVNCSVGPHGVLEAIEKLARVVTVPLSAQPNAGLPREVGDRKIYMASPEYMASYARRIVEAGARFVGGCCGTTPEHIRAVVGFVQSVSPRTIHVVATAPRQAEELDAVPLPERSRLGAKLAEGQFVTTVEIVPPKGVDPAPMFEQVRLLKQAGVDAVNVPDGPRAQSRMGALLAGLMIQREGGMEAGVRHPLPRPQPARYALRPARRRRRGHSQSAHRDRGPAQDGPVSRSDRRVRHRQHRAHQPGVATESRTGPGRQPDRHPYAVRDRGGRQPSRARSRPRASAVRLEGGGRGGMGDHPAGVRPGSARPFPPAGRAVPDSDRGRHLAAGLAPQCRIPRQRGPGRLGARGGSGAHAASEHRGEGRGSGRGREDLAGDACGGGGAGPGGPGLRAAGASAGGA